MKRLVFVLFILLFTVSSVHATKYWVDDNGTQTTAAACDGESPLSGSDACSPTTGLANINSTVAAGDTVYLRGGTYTIGTALASFIAPTHSGTNASSRIEYCNYNDEDVIIQSSANGTTAINLNAKDWIYIHGSASHELQLITNDYHIRLVGASHNEISYVKTSGQVVSTARSGVIIEDASNYNWFHHSTFTGHGGQTTSANNYFDGNYPFMIGGEGGGAADVASYNLVENNEFKDGGHDVATDNGKYNIFRNNFMHHELYLSMADNQWQTSFTTGLNEITVGMVVQGTTSGAWGTVSDVTVTSGTWAGDDAAGTINVHYAVDSDGGGFSGFTNGEILKVRNVSTNLATISGTSTQIADYGNTDVGYHVFQSYCNDGGYGLHEGNIYAYGSENLNPSNYAGNGFKINTPRNIIRYNEAIGNWLGGFNIIAYTSGATKYPTENYIYNNTTIGNGVHPATYNGSLGQAAKQHAINFDFTDGSIYVADNVVKNNLLAEYYTGGGSTCQGTTSGIWNQVTNASPTGQTIGSNWDTCLGTYADPKFTSAIVPAYNDKNLTSANNPDLTLTSESPVIDAAPYLTTATRTNDNVIAFADAQYFFDATPYASQFPEGATIASDFVCFTTSSTTVNLASDICKQIGSISGNNVTITGHGLVAETTYYVWLYKNSEGTQVLYGNATDYGAHEYDNTGEDPEYTVTVSSTGAGCQYSHSGEYVVATGETLNVAVAINNGWQNAWTGTCPATGTTTRVCTPTEASTVVGTCTQIQLFP